ncbi:MAG: hypothetical protein RBS08_00140 [Bdellovibrionales bacterium]|nr:hypothetical protein [Bdellovibrionales bacterium]
MFQKHLRKEFARAFSKATLVLMLPLTLATAMPAAAQEASPAVAPETSITAAPAAETAAQDTVFIKEGETTTVAPETKTALDTLEARYPFLKEILTDVRGYNEEFKDNPTQVLTSHLRDAENNIDIVFVSVEGPLTCGANSCQLNIFTNSGEGYKQALAVPAQSPFFVTKENKEVSIFFCSLEGERSQWVVSKGLLEHKSNVVSPQMGPACR